MNPRTAQYASLIPIAILAVGLRAATLDDVFARMDRGAREFRSMTAKMVEVDFDAVLNEADKSIGDVSMRRNHGTTAKFVFTAPEPKTYFVKGRDAELYYPKAKQAQIYDTGKLGPKQIDDFLLTGFGSPVADLRKEYDIKLVGQENVNGQPTSHIELTPKTSALKQYVAKLDLWIPDTSSYPIREKATTSSNNYYMVDFSDIKINPSVPDSVFTLDLPPDVQKTYPQKNK